MSTSQIAATEQSSDISASDIHHQSVKIPSQTDSTFVNIISIKIPNYIIKEEKLTKYVAYFVKVNKRKGFDRETHVDVLRRYSDFVKIRSVLVNRWPGCYVPPIPPKKTQISLDEKFIEGRRKGLELFCEKISMIPHLHDSEEYQIFLKADIFDPDSLGQLTNDEMIKRFNYSFSHLSDKELNNSTIAEIGTFRNFLKKAYECFDVFKKVSIEAIEARKAYYEEFANFHQVVCIGYEQNILSQYHEKNMAVNIFQHPKGGLINGRVEKIKEGANRESIEQISDWIKSEKREVEAFLEAISQRDKYEILKNKMQEKQTETESYLQKVKSGKHDIKLFLLGKSKKVEISVLEDQVRKYAIEIEELGKLHSMITLIVAYDEIKKFKIGKKEKYYQIVKVAAATEKENLNEAKMYWEEVLHTENLKAEEIDEST